jgi:hypothetical protein
MLRLSHLCLAVSRLMCMLGWVVVWHPLAPEDVSLTHCYLSPRVVECLTMKQVVGLNCKQGSSMAL